MSLYKGRHAPEIRYRAAKALAERHKEFDRLDVLAVGEAATRGDAPPDLLAVDREEASGMVGMRLDDDAWAQLCQEAQRLGIPWPRINRMDDAHWAGLVQRAGTKLGRYGREFRSECKAREGGSDG